MSPGEQTPDRGTFRCTLQVRWADFDQFGHVNNVKYIEYAQEARILFVRSRFGPFGLGNLPQVVRRVEIDHLRPVLRDSTSVDVEIEVEHVGTTSYQIRQTIFDAAGEVCCTLRVVMVAYDSSTSTAVEIPTGVRHVLEAAHQPAAITDEGPAE
ncbi:acyl-CoA thioesterase [Dietzia psychralcaliphila]|uniref:Acyl-CoA thioester hydrolase n=1 Tax=Dietzia psychralcaliphila TaxID=139021 RepID=A0AAD0JSI7_9ACTN|nr:acyl-CoA thioesterase [Dietzia psychralcaliphila]AWH95001.1 hypothetical protein A6048_05335 [Dietzia psychralcaliphila]PTM87198.1 acyl-CoA thioester hydrolase [Dietzia psychralcaliphila]